MKNKSLKRIKFINDIVKALKHPDIFDVINYESLSESVIKTYIHPHLIRELTHHYMEKSTIKHSTAEKKAHDSLLWEGDKRKIVNNITVFGVWHRPDMVIKTDDLSIAIEIKKGENGSAIREGIGQAIIYSTCYDFVIYLFIDTGKEKYILNSYGTEEKANSITNALWREFNIILDIK